MSDKFDFTLDIDGMSCNHCVMAVTKAIKGVAGVDNVEVKLQENRAYVKGPGADRKAIAEAIREAGFDVKN
jgi:copper chaperone